MDYNNQFQTDDLREIAAFDVISEEQRVIVDNAFNENELERLTGGVSDNISVISKGMIVDGNISSGAAIALNGRVNGDVRTTDDMGVSGLIVGDIAAENVHFQHAGVRGNTVASGEVTAEDDTIVVGDISATNISIDSKVKGVITAKNNVEFKRDSLIVGKVITSAIHMDESARVSATITLVNQRTDQVDDSEFDLGD